MNDVCFECNDSELWEVYSETPKSEDAHIFYRRTWIREDGRVDNSLDWFKSKKEFDKWYHSYDGRSAEWEEAFF